MSHSSILFQDNFFGCLSKTYLYLLLSSRLVGRQYTFTVHNNNLEEGRRAHLFSSNNVQCLFSDEVGATSSDDSSNRIRTATRDGDRAVGVNLVRLHRTRSASVKMFS